MFCLSSSSTATLRTSASTSPDNPVLECIHHNAGRKGLRALSSRVFRDLAAFPAYLICTAQDVLQGARVQFLEGLPGSAKTDLVAFMYLWEFCFTDLRMIVSSQQNRSNMVLRTTVLEMCDWDWQISSLAFPVGDNVFAVEFMLIRFSRSAL